MLEKRCIWIKSLCIRKEKCRSKAVSWINIKLLQKKKKPRVDVFGEDKQPFECLHSTYLNATYCGGCDMDILQWDERLIQWRGRQLITAHKVFITNFFYHFCHQLAISVLLNFRFVKKRLKPGIILAVVKLNTMGKEMQILPTYKSIITRDQPEIKLPTSTGSLKKKTVPEKHLLLLYWLCQSLWLCGLQETGKFWKS